MDDFDVAANWGNWAYFSGVGTDPKQRHFRTVSQALRYDQDGTYVQKWLDGLKEAHDKEALFRPWAFIDGWPEPLVDPKEQLTWHYLDRFEKKGRIIDNAEEASNA